MAFADGVHAHCVVTTDAWRGARSVGGSLQTHI
jgi:hypothetical protein